MENIGDRPHNGGLQSEVRDNQSGWVGDGRIDPVQDWLDQHVRGLG